MILKSAAFSTYLLQINHFLLGASIKKQIFSLYISDMRYYSTNYDLLKMILIINLIIKFHTGLSSFTLFHSKYYNIPLYGCISPQPLIGGVRTQNKLIWSLYLPGHLLYQILPLILNIIHHQAFNYISDCITMAGNWHQMSQNIGSNTNQTTPSYFDLGEAVTIR